jgi:hypothetical protein
MSRHQATSWRLRKKHTEMTRMRRVHDPVSRVELREKIGLHWSAVAMGNMRIKEMKTRKKRREIVG